MHINDGPKKAREPFDANSKDVFEFSYQGHPVNRRGDLLSLTSMWVATGRPANLKPSHWLQFPETKTLFEQFRQELVSLPASSKGTCHVPLSDDPATWLIKKRGHHGGGTWLYWDLAISYARSLSPAFHLWTNRIVRPHMERFGGPDIVVSDPPCAVSSKPLVRYLEREFGSLHLRHDEHDQALHALDQQDLDMLRLLRKMPKVLVGNRKRFSDQTKVLMILVTSMEPYDGKCPSCRENAVLDAEGRVAEGAEFDHWYDKALAFPIDGWLVCKPCHQALSKNHVATHAQSRAFHLFQSGIIASKQVQNVLARLKDD